jgi:hypothetical protein
MSAHQLSSGSGGSTEAYLHRGASEERERGSGLTLRVNSFPQPGKAQRRFLVDPERDADPPPDDGGKGALGRGWSRRWSRGMWCAAW